MTVISYGGNCNYWVGEVVYVQQCRYVNVITTCTSIDTGNPDNPSGGGGGSAGNPYPPAPTNPNDPQPAPDPCPPAMAAAVGLTAAFNQQVMKDNTANLNAGNNYESGFALMKEVRVDPNDPTKILSNNYYTTPIQTQNDETKVTISYTESYLKALVAITHTHPSRGYAPPSAADVFEVITANKENTFPLTQGSFEGSFIKASDGSIYALKVTDREAASKFLATKDVNLDGSDWKQGSLIFKDFNRAIDFFSKKSSNINSVFAEALAVVLGKHTTGVTLMKLDTDNNVFKPIIRQEVKIKESSKKVSFIDPCF